MERRSQAFLCKRCAKIGVASLCLRPHKAGGASGAVVAINDNKSREFALDGLRGLGALIVLFWHLSVHFFPSAAWGAVQPASWGWESLIYNGPFGFLISGTFAVVLFFLLSGYVLTVGYLRSGETGPMYRRMIGRIPRLFIPATATTLIVYFAYRYAPYYSGKTGIDVLKETGSFVFLEPYLSVKYDYSLRELLLNIFWQPWVSPDFTRLYNGVLWTMSIELSGSFLTMILAMVICHTLGRRAFPYAMSVLSLAPMVLYPGHGVYFSFFLFGSVIASLDLRPVLQGPVAGIICVLLLMAGLFAGGYTGSGLTSVLSFTQVNLGSTPSIVLLKGFGAILVLVVTLLSADISRFLSRPGFVWLGRISFSLYLIHATLIAYVGHFVFLSLEGSVALHYRTMAGAAATLVAALGAAALLTKWVDEPAVRFSQALGRRLLPKPGLPAYAQPQQAGAQ